MTSSLDTSGDSPDGNEPSSLNELVLLAQQGNTVALQQLLQQITPVIHQGISQILGKQHQDIGDLTQDVYLIIIQKLSDLRNPAAIISWARRSAANKTREYIGRKLARSPSQFPEDFDPASPDADPTGLSVLASECREIARSALNALKPQDRATFALCSATNNCYADMSKATDDPLGTTKRRLSVARDRLRKKMEEKGYIFNDNPQSTPPPDDPPHAGPRARRRRKV